MGGAGCAVKGGKPWDIDKLKLMFNSTVISSNFIVLHNP